ALQELKAYLDDLQRTTYSMFDSVLARYVALIQPGTPLGNIAVGELPAVNFDEWWAQGVASMGAMVGSGQLHWPVDRRSRVALTHELLLRMADGKPGLHDFTYVFLYAGGHYDDQIRAFVSQVVEPFHRDFAAIVNPYLQTEKREAAEEISVSATTRPALASLSATAMAALPFVNTTRIESLRALDGVSGFDLRKLVRLCEELNVTSREGALFAVAFLTRALMDHIPPVFEFRTFADVASQYGGGRSFRAAAEALNEFARRVADLHLHSLIRKNDALPNDTQVNFAPALDLVLAEVERLLTERAATIPMTLPTSAQILQ
ncbi:MAG: hypothetical protein ACR2M1_07440, partial [Gemmatimonadaceae bacterium]